MAILTTWGAGPVKMVANTAACFVLTGLSLWLLRKKDEHRFGRAGRAIAQASAAPASVEWKIEELTEVECDPILVRQVFQNLIGNALKYSRPRSQAVIEIGCKIDGQETVFVKDNGVGFDMKYADKVFGVFQRLHRSEDFEGTGVGLATVHRIVQKHGGRIWAQAAVGRGATFYFTLGSRGASEAKDAAAAGGSR